MSDLQDSMWLVGDANGGHVEYDEKRAREAESEGWTVIGLVTTHGARRHLAAEKERVRQEERERIAVAIEASDLDSVERFTASDGYPSVAVLGGAEIRAHAARIARQGCSDAMTEQEALERLGRACFAVDSRHHFHEDQDGRPVCLCGFVGNARKRTQTEHITAAVLETFDHVDVWLGHRADDLEEGTGR